jgi:hypothetical protein
MIATMIVAATTPPSSSFSTCRCVGPHEGGGEAVVNGRPRRTTDWKPAVLTMRMGVASLHVNAASVRGDIIP